MNTTKPAWHPSMFLGPPKPTYVSFFPNGTAGVWDQYDKVMPRFHQGDHTTTCRLLRNAGVNWFDLKVWGSPSSTRHSWALEREKADPVNCGLFGNYPYKESYRAIDD